MSQDDIDASRAPLLDHLVELRARLIKALVAFFITFFLCFYFAQAIYNVLVYPYVIAAGGADKARLIYTAPLEYFFTKVKVAMFGAAFLSFPVVATQLYKFVAPGLYRNERRAFLPFLAATPLLFTLGSALVFFLVMPMLMRFSLAQQQAGGAGEAAIELLPKVSEYLSLIMSLVLAFGAVFQLPVVLTLLARAGIIDAAFLVAKRRYAIVLAFVVAAVLTPPDVISQLSLAIPTLLLYEASILSVRLLERARARADAAATTA